MTNEQKNDPYICVHGVHVRNECDECEAMIKAMEKPEQPKARRMQGNKMHPNRSHMEEHVFIPIGDINDGCELLGCVPVEQPQRRMQANPNSIGDGMVSFGHHVDHDENHACGLVGCVPSQFTHDAMEEREYRQAFWAVLAGLCANGFGEETKTIVGAAIQITDAGFAALRERKGL